MNMEIENEEKKLMSIENEDGTTEEVEVILAFEFKDNQKEYVVYTKNEKDDNGNVTVYVSNVDRSEGEPKLLGVDSESENGVESKTYCVNYQKKINKQEGLTW